MEIVLKIDVDTHDGLRVGVPRLARLLDQADVNATFFIAMGADNSGLALIRVLRPGFISKMRRTGAISMYGWRTVLSGTLLPSRPVALAFPEIIRGLRRQGFEVGVHGYDHVRWQDGIDKLGEEGAHVELEEAFEAYRAIMGERGRAFAAPGWRVSAAALAMLDQMRLNYQSNTRGICPYRCVVEGRALLTPEIPTTLPTLDEVLGTREVPDGPSSVQFYSERFREDVLNVHTIHAETEGIGQFDHFAKLIRSLSERGASFVRMEQVAQRFGAAELPSCEVIRRTIPGRAGWVSVQGPARDLDRTTRSERAVCVFSLRQESGEPRERRVLIREVVDRR
ncbi:MAG: polysaccharide deacetylase family protein [Candidatus Binataceae bacterium]